MLFRERIGVDCYYGTININTPCEQNSESLNFAACGTHTNHCASGGLDTSQFCNLNVQSGMLERLKNPDCRLATLSFEVRGLFQSLGMCDKLSLLF
jgi:hypothetical protein